MSAQWISFEDIQQTLEEERRGFTTDPEKRRRVARVLAQTMIAGSIVQVFGPPYNPGELQTPVIQAVKA